MKKKGLLLAFAFFGSILFAQNAEEIIQKHLDSTGGIKKWNALNSIILEGECILGVDDQFDIKVYHRRPYFKRVVFVIEGNEILNEGYDGKNAWTYNAQLDENIPIPNYVPDSFENDMLNFKNKGFKANYLGKESSEDSECYKVELIKNTNKIKYCFDTKTYALVWEENNLETFRYFDYTTVNGLSFAKRVEAKTKEGGEYSLFFDNIYINPAIDDKLFKFKKKKN